MTTTLDPLDRHAVEVRGRTDGPALLLVHGFGTDQRVWRLVAPAFEATHRVVRYDHAGCGRADARAYSAARHSSLDGYARDLLDVVEALDLQDVILVGHSAGAMIGVLAAIARPGRFSRLVLAGMSPRFVDDPPDYAGGFAAAEVEGLLDLLERDQIAWSQALAPLAIGQGNPAELVDDFGAGLRRLDPLVARRFGRLVFSVDLRERLPLLDVPSLLLHCRHDSIVPIEVGRYLHRQLRRSTLVEIDGHGHCPQLTRPRETVEHVQAWLQRDVA